MGKDTPKAKVPIEESPCRNHARFTQAEWSPSWLAPRGSV